MRIHGATGFELNLLKKTSGLRGETLPIKEAWTASTWVCCDGCRETPIDACSTVEIGVATNALIAIGLEGCPPTIAIAIRVEAGIVLKCGCGVVVAGAVVHATITGAGVSLRWYAPTVGIEIRTATAVQGAIQREAASIF